MMKKKKNNQGLSLEEKNVAGTNGLIRGMLDITEAGSGHLNDKMTATAAVDRQYNCYIRYRD